MIVGLIADVVSVVTGKWRRPLVTYSWPHDVNTPTERLNFAMKEAYIEPMRAYLNEAPVLGDVGPG